MLLTGITYFGGNKIEYFSNLTYCIEIPDICQNMGNNEQRIYSAYIHLHYILVYLEVLIIMYKKYILFN